jgi:hypothetical protein
MDDDFPSFLERDQGFSAATPLDLPPLPSDPLPTFQVCTENSVPSEIIPMLMQFQGLAGSYRTHGAWTGHEDTLLAGAVAQLGAQRWTAIAQYVPTRTPKQCRERWFDRLAPGIRREPFEPWEDAIIRELQGAMGNHWSRIARQIPGRSACAVKNRWYSGLRNQRPGEGEIAKFREGAILA